MQDYTFKVSGPAFGVKSHFKPITLTFYGMTAQIVSSWLAINVGSFAQSTPSESIGITSFRMELWKSFETLTIFTSIQDYTVAKGALFTDSFPGFDVTQVVIQF